MSDTPSLTETTILQLQRELAALRKHAEAMAEYFGEWGYGGDEQDWPHEPVIAYRADFPKERAERAESWERIAKKHHERAERAEAELARVRERYSAVSSSGAIKLISDRNWGSIRREHFPMHGSWRAKAEALLAHLPDNWGDEVVDGQIMLRVDSDAIDAAMEKP